MAVITHGLLEALLTGYRATFQNGLAEAKTQFREISTVVDSTSKSNTYGWLGMMPEVREWVGSRVHNNIQTHGYAVINKLFESTVDIPRTDIEDDEIAVLKPVFENLGRRAEMNKDRLMFGLLKNGKSNACFDGQNFFDEHPVNSKHDGTGTNTMVKNFTEGTETPWYVLDCSGVIKPMLFQDRVPVEMTSVTDPSAGGDVYDKDIFSYGSRARYNGGYGFWQHAHMSQADLTEDALWDVIETMGELKGDGGIELAVNATHLVIPRRLERKATRILKRSFSNASDNELENRLQLIISPFV